ncbi:hypothetical protein cyc_01417 [Cyclospora cayetanensis]|uniref:Uncharacterized protein n=1 Tax=Cyclospora cayetanensis TaxID=88456 RepID=A0A1D3D8Q5_9EIME|nr:hypothetical protein cyc_01417 [Cyclospora cayetanensis]
MTAKRDASDADLAEPLHSHTVQKAQGSKEGHDMWLCQYERARRASNSNWEDGGEEDPGSQFPEDLHSLEHRMATIRQTHKAIVRAIDAAQGNVVKMIQDQENQYLRAFKIRTQEILEQAKKLQQSQKSPVEIETLHRMLTTTLQEAEEGAKHFSALNQTLMAKNAQLITDNQILQEQNDILLRERAIQKRQKEKQARKEPNSPRKGDRQAPMQLTPDVSPRLAGPPLTPRTLAKSSAFDMVCGLSDQFAGCKSPPSWQAEEFNGKSTVSTSSFDPKTSRESEAVGRELSVAARDEVLRKLLRTQQVIRLLHQIVTATSPVSNLDFSWLEDENSDMESESAAGVVPPQADSKSKKR